MRSSLRHIGMVCMVVLWALAQSIPSGLLCRCVHDDAAGAVRESSIWCSCPPKLAAGVAAGAETETKTPVRACCAANGGADDDGTGSASAAGACGGTRAPYLWTVGCGCMPEPPVVSGPGADLATTLASWGRCVATTAVALLPLPDEREAPHERAALARVDIPSVDPYLRISHLLI